MCGDTVGPSDAKLILSTVFVRMFSFGWIAVILFLYLIELGYTTHQIGTLYTLTLCGDLIITLYLTTQATRHGRRTTLIVSAVLKVIAGLGFGFWSDSYWILVGCATVGVISPAGGDIGPFKAVEMAALNECVKKLKASAPPPPLNAGANDLDETDEAARKQKSALTSLNWIVSWYSLLSSWALALGAMCSGFVIVTLQSAKFGVSVIDSYRYICIGYAVFGVVMLALFLGLSNEIEPEASVASDVLQDAPKGMCYSLGLRRSETRSTVAKVSALFTMDAFAGGFVMQTFITYWFHVRFGLSEDWLGGLLLGANFLAGLSALAAAPLGNRFGHINVMVFTHFPSNLLLIAVVLMPTPELAVAMLFARFSISQMDVPARNAYVMSVVARDEVDAANGIANLIRSAGVAVSPLLLAYLIADPINQPLMFSAPFIVSGVIKCLYDVLVYLVFNGYCCASDRVGGVATAGTSSGGGYTVVSTIEPRK